MGARNSFFVNDWLVIATVISKSISFYAHVAELSHDIFLLGVLYYSRPPEFELRSCETLT